MKRIPGIPRCIRPYVVYTAWITLSAIDSLGTADENIGLMEELELKEAVR